MIDAAILGLGWWGQALVASVQGKSERLRFVKAVVPDVAKRAAVAAELGVGLSTSFQEVLEDPSIGAVVVATPHSLHVEQVVATARAGKAVFCEKPLSLTRGGAQRCVDACAAAGVVLAVGHNRRFMPAIAYLQDALSRGLLGQVLHLEANSSNESARTSFSAWRAESAESPAAGMTGTGIHLLDLAVSLLGKPERVFARVSAHGHTAPPEDTCNVFFTFTNGVSATLSMVQTTPRFWRMHLFGSDGSLEILNDDEMVLYRAGQAPLRQRLAKVAALRLELDAFAQAIDRERPYPISPEQMLWTAAGMEGVCRSLATGSEESL
ncbi:Gfo/Idh/MocA family protein [Ramlibacter sp. WS9]|uniref:Gfo/Idh/MocA family protein n=1 Tax=Ramlibacter sp. WS9 TaxID=1882741 RepID=UPI001144D542|nr:Gfo/Idh/MocA family oxidoreductase [Ramlibacter sp. WS9]ROZ78114.1 gfo/Idh/MocA family oxidoreductase [Ramlibacter sp. WS9]HSV36704.1 Gfo/Idh/MocA family oxidoreductase [Ramlibacter sp.]